jgi:thiol-disulfide isomerase/thioredoxin
MKRVILFALFFSVLISLKAQDSPETGIRFFHGTFAELKAEAVKTGKPIFIDAFTTWCGPCKWMAKTVFPDEEVGKVFNEKFICAKIDMEKGEGIDIARQYQVNAYPTLLFMNGSGEIIHLALGARDAKEFIKLGLQAIDPQRNLMGMQKKFNENPSAIDAAMPYFQFLSESGNASLAEATGRWFAGQPKTAWTNKNNWRILFDFVEDPAHPAFQHLVNSRSQFETLYSTDSVESKLRKTYFMHLQRAAHNGDLDAWKADSSAIQTLALRDGPRYLAISQISLAGDDIELSLSRIMYLMKQFPSNDPDELNSYAWRMFEVSQNPVQLASAEDWARKALGLNKESYAIHDTYASLLFKNKKYPQAKTEATAAIAKGQKSGEDVSATEALLVEINEALASKKSSGSKKASAKKEK